MPCEYFIFIVVMVSVLMEKTLFWTSEVQLNKSFVLIVFSSFFAAVITWTMSVNCVVIVILWNLSVQVSYLCEHRCCHTEMWYKSHGKDRVTIQNLILPAGVVELTQITWLVVNIVPGNSYFTLKVLIISDSFQICFCSFCTWSSITRNPHSQTLTKSFH